MDLLSNADPALVKLLALARRVKLCIVTTLFKKYIMNSNINKLILQLSLGESHQPLPMTPQTKFNCSFSSSSHRMSDDFYRTLFV